MPFQKGNKLGKGRIKGSKNRETLLHEERRAIFNARVSQKWEETIDKLKPEYIADQFMGKAPDELNVKGELIVQLSKVIAKKNNVPTSDTGSSGSGQAKV